MIQRCRFFVLNVYIYPESDIQGCNFGIYFRYLVSINTICKKMVSKWYLFCLKVSFSVKKGNWTMSCNRPKTIQHFVGYTTIIHHIPLYIIILLVVGWGGCGMDQWFYVKCSFRFPFSSHGFRSFFSIWYLIFICLVSKRYLFSFFFGIYLVSKRYQMDFRYSVAPLDIVRDFVESNTLG